MNERLFCAEEVGEPPAQDRAKAAPRMQSPNRSQVEFRAVDLESLIAPDHRVRVVWEFVEGLDLRALYGQIKAVEGHVGRSPIDPAILMGLWLYATLDGVGSARELARLCEAEDAYRWLCGGVSVNHHSLSDFRVEKGEFLDRQLTQSVAALLAAGAVTMNRVAQDGMRVRASAGASSLRRKERLEGLVHQAEVQVQALKQELKGTPSASRDRQQAARERAVKDRHERVKRALEQLPEVEAKKKAADKNKARVSTTDAEARVMKMGDGGFRPAYNAQFCTDTETQVIVGLDISNEGSDKGQMAPMIDQIEQRYEQRPEEILVDGGFVTLEDIEKVSTGQTPSTVYAPVQVPKDQTRDPHQPLEGDSHIVAAWRGRMGTEEAKAIYKQRAATAECVNAQARNRGLQQFRVRGLAKVKAVLLWYALAHNLMRRVALGLSNVTRINRAQPA